MKALKCLSLLLALAFCVPANGKTLFIQYDQSCMDRYEYRYNGTGNGHIAYHIRRNDREKIVLEVGIESKIQRPDRPANVLDCSSFSINERMVREINDGETQIFIVRRDGNGYNVSPVGIATYSQISPTFVGYTSVDHKFVYNFNQPANNQNLAMNSSTSKVYFRGPASTDCPSKLRFERTKERAGRSYTEMILVPEIGVIEERTGFNKTDADNNRLMLMTVNNTPLDQYLGMYCSGKSAGNSVVGKFYHDPRSTTASTGNNSIFDLEGGNPNATTSTGQPTHTPTTATHPTQFQCTVYKNVDDGRYYDRATGQLANTECGGNSYRNGYMISKTQPTTTTAPTTVVTTTPTTTALPVVTTPGNPNTSPSRCREVSGNGYHVVQLDETLYGISRMYNTSVADIKSMNGLRNNMIKPCMKLKIWSAPAAAPSSLEAEETLVGRGANPGYHVVQAGETLYGISKRYGFTPGKLRQINSLQRDELIYVGQRLKTQDCNCPADGSTSSVATNRPTNIPVAAEFVAERGGQPTPASYEYSGSKRRVHIVKDDETLYGIARAYNLTVERLRALNDLEENEIIIPYQRLYIN